MRALLLLLLALSAASVAAQTVVTGTVTGDGEPLAYATVHVVGTGHGGASGARGRFRFSTASLGAAHVEARFVGYEPARVRVELAGDTVRVALRLRTSLLDLDGAVVSADALAGTSQAGTGLTALDVVTTPGASADVLQAVQTMAGLTQVDEGAGLFVRGGDVGEARVLLDGVPLLQPYAFETPLGGTFGTVQPFLIQGTAFSTGGFSARYGDALSGVLALDTQHEPTRAAQTVTLSLAAASLNVDQPVGDGGVRLAANRTFTDALFWVNGTGADFETAPRATTASALAAWPDVAGGRLKVLALATRDHVGVRLADPTFDGVLTSTASSALGLASWRRAGRRWHLDATLGVSGYGSEQSAGSLRLAPADRAVSGRVEAQRVTSDVRWSVGAEGRRLTSRFDGAFSPDGDLAPAASVVRLEASARAVRGGAWAEAEAQLSRRLVVRAGLRADGQTDLGTAALSPRLQATVALTARTQARLAWGVYRQAPALDLDPSDADAGVATARHAVAGVLHERGDWTFRAEAYHKLYRDLAVARDERVWSGEGAGRAQGVDLFARLAAASGRRWHGWASYSWLATERTQLRRDGAAAVLERGPAPFDIRHALNVVGSARVAPRLTVGGRLRVSSGRPVVDVVDAVRVGGALRPVEGPVGGARLPAYVRLDATVSYRLAVPGLGSLVLFGAANNLLDRPNEVGRVYAPDYGSWTPDVTAYRRSVYAGASLTL